MPLRAVFPALTALVLLSLSHSGTAVPTIRSPLSRGIFDFFTSSSEQTSLPPTSTDTTVADLTDSPLDSAPEDEAALFEQPSPSLSPSPSSTPLSSLSSITLPSATPQETVFATETPLPDEDTEAQIAEQTPEATTSPSPIFVIEGATNPEQLFAPETDPMSDDKAVDNRSSGATQIASTASTGISVVALVAVAVAVLAPALLIYYGIRRRRAAGFNAMPPTQTDTSTYRPASQFSVGE